jgi:NADPH:quinone reductase-like Zn-dependent oxidoreductase
MTRQGNGADVDLPWTPGWDFSGVVEAVGTNVTVFDVGDEVFGMLADERGTYAEYVPIPATNLVRKPHGVSHVVAAGTPMVALTAWQALFDAGGLRPTQRVLIHAAAGGVGHVAVQLANWVGAQTIGTASGSNEASLLGLGVDGFVNYRDERFEEAVGPVDLVVDAVGGDTFERSLEILRAGGHISKLPGPLTTDESELLAQSDATGSYPVVQWRPEQLASVARLVDANDVDVWIEAVLPLDRAVEAHRRSESGHARGTIVIEMPTE